MPEILLINPRRRAGTGRKKVARKRRTAAQKAATRKMIAANRRRKNPVRRKRRATKKASTRRRRRNPVAAVRRRRSTRRSNPALNVRNVQKQLMEAGIGATGALGLDVLQGYLPIPANLKGGIVGTGVKALLAIGMGMLAANFKLVRGPTAAKMANGALTVVLHDELKKQVANFAPGIQMGEYLDYNGMGYYGSGYNPGVIDDPDAMGTYLPELDVSMQQDGFGEYMNGERDYMDNMAYS